MPRFADYYSPAVSQECARPGKSCEASGNPRHWTGAAARRVGAVWIIVAGLGGLSRAGPAEIAELVGRVSVDSYRSYLQDDLYAHMGDDRSCLGAEHKLAMVRIQERFASFGLTTTLGSPVTICNQTHYNVIGIHEGVTCPQEVYLVGAHYDSSDRSPGAWDNASGVAGVLEAARVLSQVPFEATIIFIAFDGGQVGRRGSRAYAQEHALDDIRAMICLDGIAYRPYQPGEPDYQRVGLYYAYADAILLHDLSQSMESYGALTCVAARDDLSDDMPFGQVGFAAASLIAQGLRRHPPYMHTLLDAVETPGWIDYEYGTAVTAGVVGYLASQARPVVAHVLPDFDGNGHVDYQDLMRLAQCWLARDACDETDVNHDGRVDIHDYAFLAQVWGRALPPGPANSPIPDHGALRIDPDVVLTWSPGQGATRHEMYFGTAYQEVRDADASSPIFIPGQTVCSWKPGRLDPGTTYYWRVDERSQFGLTKGRVWKFTTRKELAPVARWTFDEGTGETAAESIGGGRAQLYGAAWATGIRGGAVSFDGMDDYVDCGDDEALTPQQMTMAFWMQPEGGTPATQYVLAKTLSMGVCQDYAVTYRTDGHIQFLFAQSELDTVQLTSDATVATGQWVHVMAIRDGSTALLYLDGTLQAAQPYSFVPQNKQYPLRIGTLVPSAPFGSFQGKVDELRIYDQALTAEEVLGLYHEEAP